MRIDVEQLLHREADWSGEFHDAEMSSLLQYSAHFAQSLVQVLEVADAEGGCYRIKGVVFV